MFVIVLYDMGHFVKIYDINKLIVIEDFFFLIINDMVPGLSLIVPDIKIVISHRKCLFSERIRF